MGSRKRSRSTKRPQLASVDPTIERLLKIIEEKDAQIRMVLEERFYRPIQPAPNRRIESTVVNRPEDVTDVVRFDPEDDRSQIERETSDAETADANLAQLLNEEGEKIAAEQAAAHVGETVRAKEPIEMLDRIIPDAVEPVKGRAARSREAARQIAGGQE